MPPYFTVHLRTPNLMKIGKVESQRRQVTMQQELLLQQGARLY